LLRIFLDDLPENAETTPGIQLLQLVSAPKDKARRLVTELVDLAKHDTDCDRGLAILQLVEELLMRRFTELNREEIRKMFQLHDLKESKVWQEAEEIGREQGWQEGRKEGQQEGRHERDRELVRRMSAAGRSLKEIAELLELPLADVRRISREK
jgi:predicted transposase/invertase (TIGR01784 family)